MGLNTFALIEYIHQFCLSPLVDINENREILAKSAHSEHVVARIPLAIRHQIKQFALVALDRLLTFISGVPYVWLAVFRARDEVQSVGRNRTPYHQVLALCSKQSFLYPWALGRLVLD